MSETNRPTAGSIETRALDVSADGKRLRGRIPYRIESRDMGGFREVIEPGALKATKLDDLVATVDHVGVPIGRYPGTLEVEDRTDGMHWSVEPPESRADVREAVERGDLKAGSWRMIVGRDEWRGDVRHVHEIAELRDVAVVTNPAYSSATVELRSHESETPSAAADSTNAAERQEDNMETEDRNETTTESATEDRSEAPESTEDRGGLAVEDRTAAPEASIEDRVVESLRSVRKGETRSLTVASDGAIAPPELSTFLFEKLRASSIALQSGVQVIATDRSEVQWPKLTTDVAPAFYAEGETITPGDPGFDTLTATPKKIAHIVEASNEVIDDSDPSVIEVLNAHLATVLGLKLDASVYEGDGDSGDGIVGLANVVGIQNAELPVDYDAFIEAVGLLQAANVPGPYVAAGPPAVFTALGLLKNGTLDEQLAPPREMPEVFTSTQLTETFVYAPSQLVLVRRQDATIELDRSRLFNADKSEVRGKLRADLLVPNPAAVVALDGDTGS